MGALEGYRLNITSGWRSLEYQQMLFDRAIVSNGSIEEASKWVLPPQFSNHPWGLAVDINYKQGSQKQQLGLKQLVTNLDFVADIKMSGGTLNHLLHLAKSVQFLKIIQLLIS